MATAGVLELVLELEVALGPNLTAQEAAAIFAQGEEAVVFALLELARPLKQVQGPLQRCTKTRTRYTEDIPAGVEPVVTEHTIHRELIATPWQDSQAKRLVKRFKRPRHDLLAFLDYADVPYDNNAGERAIRPAVIIRKNSYCNCSQRSADAQAALMSMYRRSQNSNAIEPLSNRGRKLGSEKTLLGVSNG